MLLYVYGGKYALRLAAGLPRCLGRLRGLQRLAFTAREDVSLLHLPNTLTEFVLHADCKGCNGQVRHAHFWAVNVAACMFLVCPARERPGAAG